MKVPFLLGAALFAAGGHIAAGAELQPGTLLAWEAYLHEADFRAQQRAGNCKSFLWMDEAPDRAARVSRGEAVVEPAVGRGTEGVPEGLIHDWIGAIFIPNATIGNLQAVIHDYDRYQRLYRPAVTESRTLESPAGRQEFSMVWHRRVLFVNAAVQGRYESRDFTVDAHRGYNIADAVDVREIADYGRKAQRLLPAGMGNGFLWRLHSIARYEERDGGVYLEMEAMALTRDIPGSVSWLVGPVVNRLSINSLTTMLLQTRDAVSRAGRNSEVVTASAGPRHTAR